MILKTMVSHSSIPGAPERKSRRTHKNSRDGCPNCKAKRVKCSEELPECSNCVKRNSRCGYLDFPREKLEHIRQKNEKKEKKGVFLNDSPGFNHQIIKSPLVNVPKMMNAMNSQRLQIMKSEPIIEGPTLSMHEDSRNSINSVSSKGSITSISKQFSISLNGSQPPDYSNYPNDVINNSYPYYNRPYDIYQAVSHDYHAPLFSVPSTSSAIDLNDNQDEVQDGSFQQQFPYNFQQSPMGTSSDGQTPQQINLIQPPLFNDAVNRLSNLPVHNHITTNVDANAAVNANANANITTSTNNTNTTSVPLQQHHDAQQQHLQLPTPISTNNQPINQIQTQLLPHNSFTNFEVPNFADYYDFTNSFNDYYNPYNFDQDINQSTETQAANKTKSTNKSLQSVDSIKKANESTVELPKLKKIKKSLPNSINEPTKFSKLKYDDKYDELKSDIVYFYLPVWNQELINKFWQRCITQSFNNPVLFSFLLDKSLALLISEVNVVLSSDYLKNFHNTYQAVSNSDSIIDAKYITPKNAVEVDFFYNQKTLTKFIKLSFRYYRTLISNIKLYLNDFHVGETIRISMLSSYTSYFLLNSSFESSIKLNYGTTSLINKFVNECTDYTQLSPTIRYCIDITSDHANFCLVKDLDFDVIRKIGDQFKIFKSFLVTGTSLYQTLRDSQTIRDFLPKHDCIEFENFINLLLDKFLPKSMEINKAHGCPEGHKFVAPNDLYEVVNAYYKMIPAITNVLGSKTYVLQRVFYLIYIALGKALNQVLNSVRCLFNMDISSVMHTKIDFNFSSFKINQKADGLTDDQYQYLDKITKNLLRFISFLNYRNLFYSHYLSNSSVLSKPVIELVDKNRGIIEILPEKLDFKEKPLEIDDEFNFQLTFEHFPQFPEFKHYPKACFDTDTDASNDQEEFNYDVGLYKSDYNPTRLVNEFLNLQKSKWEFSTVRLTELKTRMNHFNEIKSILNETIDDDN